jgi:hypothetical protein
MAPRLRSIGRSLALITVALAFASGGHVSAQNVDSYERIVERYVRGDADGAVGELARWARGDVTSRSKEWVRRVPPDRLRQAVMLHTDLAYVLLVRGATGDGVFHMSVAQTIVQRIVQQLGSRASEMPPQAVFAQRWHEVAASIFTGHALFGDADWVVRNGITLFPRDAMLYVARGVIMEELVVRNLANAPAATQATGNVPRLAASTRLDLAAADYRRALAFDPTLAMGSLRLAWIHLRTGEQERAAQEAETALRHATGDRLRYLSHLVTGRIAERAARLDAARDAYDAALAIGGGYQTAYVAVSRIYEALGQRDHARAVAQEYAGLTEKTEDPWWDFNIGGFDAEMFIWLRTEAQRP